jgi:hypothetical protein
MADPFSKKALIDKKSNIYYCLVTYESVANPKLQQMRGFPEMRIVYNKWGKTNDKNTFLSNIFTFLGS